MIAPAHLVIETQTCAAAFGLALWDAATGRLAGDGLVVRVAPQVAGRTLPAVVAAPNRRGIFVIHRLPVAAVSPPAALLVDVRDPMGRFVPFVMHLDAAGGPGLLAPPCLGGIDGLPADSPPGRGSASGNLPGVPLFSTPARTPQAGAAVVRTALVDGGSHRPAAFAVIEVREGGRVLGRGVADARGEVAISFPYPEPSVLPPWSPPARPAPPVPLTSQSWTLDVAVRYHRDLPRYGMAIGGGALRDPSPDVCELLAQPLARLAIDSPPAPVTEIRLHYGQELVLAGPNGDPLLVNPA